MTNRISWKITLNEDPGLSQEQIDARLRDAEFLMKFLMEAAHEFNETTEKMTEEFMHGSGIIDGTCKPVENKPLELE